MSGSGDGLVHSVHQRLVNLAHQGGEETQAVLTRFGIERLLYRLSLSPYSDDFVLKGAMLFRVWSGALHRPTTDLDLLGFGRNDREHLEDVFRAICAIEVEPDGLVFDAEGVRAAAIRADQEYEGVRVRMVAYLGRARIPLQVDVGFGDAVVPAPRVADYPAMLSFPMARLRTYSMESVVAEKFQAMVALGVTNSRLKDYYDVWMLSRREAFDGETLCRALTVTFGRRRTPLPASTPLALTSEFYGGSGKEAAWRAFLRRSHLDEGAASLADAVSVLREFLMPPASAARDAVSFARMWRPGGPWHDS